MVGRPERVIDPDADVVQQFAAHLRALRERAGRLTYRQLAARAGYSVTALSEAAGGRRFPSLPVALAYVRACAGDGQEWASRWRAVDEILAQRARARLLELEPPYLGLATFQPTDVGRFFGREAMVADLLRRIGERPFLAVFGPSGSGKSSLLRAGLIASVASGALAGQWLTVLCVPGEHPAGSLAAALAATLGVDSRAALADLTSGASDLGRLLREELVARPRASVLLVVDQFEEIFTLCHRAGERVAFVEALCEAAGGADGRVRVVVGVRADFYARCAELPALVRASRDAMVLVGPMSAPELARAVTKPAQRAGISVDRTLVTAVIHDAASEPGALPLVSHVLLETWLHRRGDTLTLAGYEAVGGVYGALAGSAEQVYNDLSAHQKVIARRLLVRLVALGDGMADTRRRVAWSELDGHGDPDSVEVVERLVKARLLVCDTDLVQVAHEALIHAWPRLGRWLSEDRAGLRIHQQLTAAAKTWQSLGRETGALYRGSRLAATRDWVDDGDHRDALTRLERDFLDASTAVIRAERAAALRHTRMLRGLAMALTTLLVVAVGVSTVAVRQRQQALSRQLAAEAQTQAGLDMNTATRLALRAYRTAPTPQARSALLSIAGHPTYQARLGGHDGEVKAVVFPPDGHTVISGGQDRTIVLWDLALGTRLAVLRGQTSAVRALALSSDGRLLASAGRDGAILMWDLRRRTLLRTLTGHTDILDGVAFSPDGHLLASVGVDHTTVIWDVASGTPRTRLNGYGGSLTEVTFSPDGRTVAVAGDDGDVALWDWASGQIRTLRVSAMAILAVAFSPDGGLLAAAGKERTITVWDVASGARTATLYGHVESVRGLAFSPDGGFLVSAGYDRQAVLWDVHRGGRISNLTGHAGALYAVAVSPDARHIAAASADGTVIVWSRARMPLVGHTGWVSSVAFSHNGRLLATGGVDTTARLWDVTSRTARAVMVASPTAPGPATPSTQNPSVQAVFSPDDRILATGGDDSTIRLWDTATGNQLALLVGHRERVTSLAFSPDGKLLASAGGHDGTVRLWDVPRRSAIQILQSEDTDAVSVAFSPDGRLLASGNLDKTVTVWNMARRTVAATVSTASGIAQLAFSPDGRLLAAASVDGAVTIWNSTNQHVVTTLAGNRVKLGAIAFSPDGRLLASGGLDHDITLWDLSSFTRYATLSGHTDLVLGLAFSPDSAILASASGDHTVITWSVDPRHAESQMKNGLARR